MRTEEFITEFNERLGKFMWRNQYTKDENLQYNYVASRSVNSVY